MKKWPLKPGLATPRPKAPFCFLASQTHLEAFSWIEYTRVNQNFVTQVTISLDWKIRFSVFAQLGFTWRSAFEYKPIGLADSILLDLSFSFLFLKKNSFKQNFFPLRNIFGQKLKLLWFPILDWTLFTCLRFVNYFWQKFRTFKWVK